MAKQQMQGAPQDTSLFQGGLAGLLASTVLGGPVGAAVGLGVGLLSERMHRSELDMLTDSYNAIQKYGSDIQDQITGAAPWVDQHGDPSGSDHEQLDSIRRDAARAQEFSQHYDPAIRQAGVQQLMNTGARMDAFYNDIEDRTQHLQDQQFELEKATASHYQEQFEKTQDSVRQMVADKNQAMQALNDDPSVSKVETKAALLRMQGMTVKEASQDSKSWSVGFLGTGFSGNFDDFSPTYDEALKMIKNQETTQIQAATDYLTQLTQSMQQNGYSFNTTAEGQVSVHSVNSAVQQFKNVAPKGPGPQAKPVDPLNTEGRQAHTQQQIQDVQNWGRETVRKAQQFIHDKTNRTKRPTNK